MVVFAATNVKKVFQVALVETRGLCCPKILLSIKLKKWKNNVTRIKRLGRGI